MNQSRQALSAPLRQSLFVLLVLIVAAILSHAIVVVFNVVDTNWDFEAHFAWASQFSDAFRSGNPYPRWMPLGNHGLGEPVTLFYSPLFYYMVSLIDFFLDATWNAMRWATVLSTGVAGFVTWLIMRPMVSVGWALLAAVAVQTAPMIFMIYHYFNGYPWGASFSAYSLFLLFSLRYFIQRKSQYFPLVSLAALLLVLAHIVSSMMVFLCMGISVLILAWLRSDRRWSQGLAPVVWWGVSALFGIGMACFYLWPALFSLDLVASSNWQDRYPPQDAFAFPTITAYLYGMRWFSMQWVVPGLILFSVSLSTLAYRRWAQELDSTQRQMVLFLLVLSWVSLFFASELSYLLWLDRSPLLWIQSPHRFTYVSCLPALLTNVFWLDRLWKKQAHTLEKLLLLGSVFASISLFLLLNWKLFNVGTSKDALASEALQPYGSYPEYRTAAQTEEAKKWVDQGGLSEECRSLGINCIEGIEKYSWTINGSRPTSMRLPILAFPSWKVTISDEEVESRTDPETGLLQIDVGASVSRVQVTWRRLPQERQGAWISILFVFFFCVSALLIRGRSRLDNRTK